MDPALIRPGRVDVKVLIDYCSDYQLQNMFLRFYADEPEHRAAEFAEKVKQKLGQVSPAQVQGFFMFHKDNAQDVMNSIQDMDKV